jgi:alkylation response protein AidB-like acyl-CoA dehydrogenase
MGTSVSMDETRTPDRETSPGWRELLENLYVQLEDARARELFLQRLLCEERRELQRLRGTGRSLPAAAGATPRGPSALHVQIIETLAAHPAGLTCAQVEAAVGTGQPLGNVLDGLARRGHVRRLGKGVFAVPQSPGTTQEERNRDGHTHR